MRNHCSTISKQTYYGGEYIGIGELTAKGEHAIEICGSSKQGFMPMLADSESYVPISTGPFTLKRDCVAALQTAFGPSITIRRGRNWY